MSKYDVRGPGDNRGKEIATIENGACFGRSIWIDLREATCDVCNERGTCICIDTSEGEYGPGSICPSCAVRTYE